MAQENTSAEDQNNWSIRIVAQSRNAKDIVNFAGIRGDASPGWDQHDLCEPPPIGDYISLYFPHSDWTDRPNKYTADFRPISESGHTWAFDVETNYQIKCLQTFDKPVDLVFHEVDKAILL